MRIGITGATGFLGKRVLDRLLSKHDITAFVRNTEKLPLVKTNHFDLNKPEGIDLSNIDIFIHCAAYLPKSYEDPNEAEKCLLNNSIATLKLLQAAHRAGVKKFVQISSGTIYDPSLLIAKEDDRIFPYMRATYYLSSKAIADIYVNYFNHHSKINTVILRPSSIYGPGMIKRGLVPRLVNKLKNDEQLKDDDVGNYEVDLVYVDDVAWMVEKVATDEIISGTFNVGGGIGMTTIKVLETMAKILGKEIPNIIQQKSLGHAMLDISKACNIGYNPRSLEYGLKSYIESLD